MSVDKLVDSTQLDTDLTSVANAIRTKGGTSAQLAFPSGFVQAIADIPSGGGGTYQNIFVSEFTPASATSSITFSISDIGFVPDCCMYYAKDFVVQESYARWTTMACECANLLVNKGTCQGYTTTGTIDFVSTILIISGTNVNIPCYRGFQEGTTYSLVLLKIKE